MLELDGDGHLAQAVVLVAVRLHGGLLPGEGLRMVGHDTGGGQDGGDPDRLLIWDRDRLIG